MIDKFEIDLIESYKEQMKEYIAEIKDLKFINKRLESKLKQCSECELSANKWAMITIREHAENIIAHSHSHLYEAKQIIDKCNEVLK